jgi:hypothetical protein
MQVFFYKTGLVESHYLPEGTTFDDIDVAIDIVDEGLDDKQIPLPQRRL